MKNKKIAFISIAIIGILCISSILAVTIEIEGYYNANGDRIVKSPITGRWSVYVPLEEQPIVNFSLNDTLNNTNISSLNNSINFEVTFNITDENISIEEEIQEVEETIDIQESISEIEPIIDIQEQIVEVVENKSIITEVIKEVEVEMVEVINEDNNIQEDEINFIVLMKIIFYKIFSLDTWIK